MSLGIATVYQDLALCDNLDVVANLFLGREEISDGPGLLTRQLEVLKLVEALNSMIASERPVM